MNLLRTFCLVLTLAFAMKAFATPEEKPAQAAADAATPQTTPAPTAADSQQNEVNERWMVEGQKRYSTNCGRCHQAPHQFSPREMAMAVRHMRVRAMLTQEDMDYLLYYMTHQ